MSAKTIRVHKYCGGRMIGKSNMCARCRKWVDPAGIVRVKVEKDARKEQSE